MLFSELDPFKKSKNGFFLYAKIQTESSSNKIGKIYKRIDKLYGIKIYVTAIAKNNEANNFVLKFLSKTLNIPSLQIKLIKGQLAKEKIFKIQGKEEDIYPKLKSLCY